MPPKPRIKLESHFLDVKDAMGDALEDALDHATGVMEGEAEKRIERIDDTKGYDLPIDIKQERGRKAGRIVYDHFFGRWFEYGTVFIAASPFMRPAHRKGKKALLEKLPENATKFIRRRVR